jgi:undecaprenyl-diphosphatase
MDAASALKAALLGLVEGLTEFIPVSSTGHLILAREWLGFAAQFGEGEVARKKADAFLIVIQLGAILAVLWLYRSKFLAVAAGLPKRDPWAWRLVTNLVVGTIPAVVIGLPTDDWIEAHFFKPLPVALALAIGGVAILLVERFRRTPTIDDADRLPTRHALGVGLFQVLAILFPGVSRSGATIMGGLTLGLSRTAATEFSFFLAIPAICGATLVKILGVRDALTPSDLPLFAVGLLVSFVSAVVVIRALLVYVARHSFAPFAWYRIVFGATVAALYWNASEFG